MGARDVYHICLQFYTRLVCAHAQFSPNVYIHVYAYMWVCVCDRVLANLFTATENTQIQTNRTPIYETTLLFGCI